MIATIEAMEERDIMLSADIPNAFVQTDIDCRGQTKVIVKIVGALVDMLLKMERELYERAIHSVQKW